MLTKNGSKNVTSLTVELDVVGLDSYQVTKKVNDFLRTSIREFGNTHSVVNYEIKECGNGCDCGRCRNNHL